MPGKTVTLLDDDQWSSLGFRADLRADPESSALGVIDVQRYCLDPASHLARTLSATAPEVFSRFDRQARAMVANVGRLQRAFRDRGRRVLFTRHGALLPDGSDLTPRRRRREDQTLEGTGRASGHLPARGEPAHEILAEVGPRPGELVLDKDTASAFHSTPLDLLLRNMGVRSLVLAGVAAEQCVLLTALDAADRGFEVILAADACAGFDPGVIEACFTHFGRVYGHVMTTDEVLAWLAGGRASGVTAEREGAFS